MPHLKLKKIKIKINKLKKALETIVIGMMKNVENFFANNLKILWNTVIIWIHCFVFAAAILSEKVIRMRYLDLWFSDIVSVTDNRKWPHYANNIISYLRVKQHRKWVGR